MAHIYKCFEKNIGKYAYLYNFGKEHEKDSSSYVSKNYNIESYGGHIISSLHHPVLGETIKKAIMDSYELLTENSLVNSYNTHGFIEYHRYTNGKNMPLDKHIDDYGAVNYTVNTVIFYLNKTVEGGDLEIYEDDEETLKEVIDVKPSENKIKIVIMEGNLCHYINQIKTQGIRECVVVQLKCVR